jgi:hypothetical protein
MTVLSPSSRQEVLAYAAAALDPDLKKAGRESPRAMKSLRTPLVYFEWRITNE